MKKFIILSLIVVDFMGCGVGLNNPITQGPAGAPGANGHSMVFTTVSATSAQCSNGGYYLVLAVDSNDNGVLDLTDSNVQSMTLCNGSNGTNATQSPLTPVSFVTPCGPNSSAYKEVLLVLADGQVLASFSDNTSGTNTRLALIPDGSYQDTDSSHCNFTISTTGTTRTASWSGGSQSWQVSQ